MKIQNNKNSGLTLVELMVVITIIGLLSAIVYANFGDVRKQARDKVRMTDLKEIQLALELYKSQNSQYPTGLSSLVTEGFLPVVPSDPSGSAYSVDTNASRYKVWTTHVESLTIKSYNDDFARCPSPSGGVCPATVPANTYAVYSPGGEGL
jgi:prepilin-type N-terminal cleavage/methylation domain-containing protein